MKNGKSGPKLNFGLEWAQTDVVGESEMAENPIWYKFGQDRSGLAWRDLDARKSEPNRAKMAL